MDLYLKGKTALVTGASQGIGRAIVKELALEGVQVLAVGRNETLLNSLQEELRTAGGVLPETLALDLLDPDAPRSIVETALARLGHIDILINNAGRSQPLEVVGSEDVWTAAMTLDFERPRQLTQQLIPHFIERHKGVILNLVSSYELRSINGSAVAKASIAAWSKALATQLGPYGIRVNCLQPGLIDTENIRRFFPGDERRQFAESEIPLGDFGHPQDMANMATFLVSPRTSYVTGTVAIVDGGMRRYPF